MRMDQYSMQTAACNMVLISATGETILGTIIKGCIECRTVVMGHQSGEQVRNNLRRTAYVEDTLIAK
jgi:hypothetical protein